MSCDNLKLPNGGFAIVCSRSRRPQRCRWCTHTPGRFLCDWKLGAGKTCDKPICAEHAEEVAPDKHLCPEHQVAYKKWLGDRKPSDGAEGRKP